MYYSENYKKAKYFTNRSLFLLKLLQIVTCCIALGVNKSLNSS